MLPSFWHVLHEITTDRTIGISKRQVSYVDPETYAWQLLDSVPHGDDGIPYHHHKAIMQVDTNSYRTSTAAAACNC